LKGKQNNCAEGQPSLRKKKKGKGEEKSVLPSDWLLPPKTSLFRGGERQRRRDLPGIRKELEGGGGGVQWP